MFIWFALSVCGNIQYFVGIVIFDYGDEEGEGDPSSPNYDPWYNIEWKIAGGAVTGVLIPILNLLYQQAARALTNWVGGAG